MSANRLTSTALLIVGIALIIFGIHAAESISSEISELFTGNPTDRAIWMFVGGIVLAIIGFFGTLRNGRARPGLS